MRRFGVTLIMSALASSALADIQLIQPIDCTLGDSCYIQQSLDHDPSSGASDFRCGSQTYDGHKGTDFALPTIADQIAGVDVVAAADGRVVGVRNNMQDILQGHADAPDISNRECGNGLVLQHKDGWETQYCHLAQGSVSVRSGQMVAAGDVLGQVGLSGQSEFPHLHLSVRKDGQHIDPFAPDGQLSCGSTPSHQLWKDPIAYPSGGLVAAAFTDGIPEFSAIKSGNARLFNSPNDLNALVIWGHVFGARTGDTIAFLVTGPAGEFLDTQETLTRTSAQLFRASGRRTPSNGWPPGEYSGVVTLTRDGAILDQMEANITLE